MNRAPVRTEAISIWQKLERLAKCSALSPLEYKIVDEYREGWTLTPEQEDYVERLFVQRVRPNE